MHTLFGYLDVNQLNLSSTLIKLNLNGHIKHQVKLDLLSTKIKNYLLKIIFDINQKLLNLKCLQQGY